METVLPLQLGGSLGLTLNNSVSFRRQGQKRSIAFSFIVERKKACQMAGRSIGKGWQRGKGKSIETCCSESLFVLSVCVSILAISNRCQKTVLLPMRG